METTDDTLFEGRVRLKQPARGFGYRANEDAVLLASFAVRPSPARQAFDLGAGAGAVGLSLVHLGGALQVALVEIDAAVAALAQENLEANGVPGEVLLGDVRQVAEKHRGQADLVVCNPPYVPPGRGRVPEEPARALGRCGELLDFVVAARLLVGARGRVCFVYPARELVTLVEGLRAAGLEPKRLKAVHARQQLAARVVLIEAQPAKRGGLEVLAPQIDQSPL